MYVRIIVNDRLIWVTKTATIGYDKVLSLMSPCRTDTPRILYCLPGGSNGIMGPGNVVRLKEATIFKIAPLDSTDEDPWGGECPCV